jgi:hypothetical protein
MFMTATEINELPELVAGHRFNKDGACEKIITDMYLHPAGYYLGRMTGDDLGDFVLSFLPVLKKLADKYNPGQGPLLPYLRSCIRVQLQVFKRQRRNASFSENCLRTTIGQLYEDAAENYSRQEYSLRPPKHPDPEELRTAHYTAVTRFKLCNTKSILKTEIKKKVILVLALKSCYYLDDDDITRVAETSGCDRQDLVEKIRSLRASLDGKAERSHRYQEQRNRAYFYHKRYTMQLSYLEPGTRMYDILHRRDKKQQNCWKNKTCRLQHNFLRIAPSNKDVAALLGICERQVCYYISYAKKSMEKQST